MKPTIKKYHCVNDGKDYIQMQIWLVVIEKQGNKEISQVFSTLQECEKFAETDAKETAKHWCGTLIEGETQRAQYNVTRKYIVEGSDVWVEDNKISYSFIMRTLTKED